MSAPSPPLHWIGLAGPTASGKTAAALALAAHSRAIGGPEVEIVSVDSALVYRGLDIGSAKPSAAERAAAPHHLIDIREPDQPYSAAEFAADARALVDAIRARGHLPLLVGGTMLYFKALIDGLDALPAADATVRAALDEEARARGWPALHAELATVDPLLAARLAPGDAQRIQRALEVWRLTGRPLSSFQRRHAAGAGSATAGGAGPHLLVSLEPRSRAWLHDRIAQRLDAMFEAGLLDEVRALRRRAGVHADLPALRAVGYRQCWAWLDEAAADAAAAADPRLAAGRGARPIAGGPVVPAALREQAIAATRQLAKRQLTWLRSLPDRRVLACDLGAPGEPAARLCAALDPLLRRWPAASAELVDAWAFDPAAAPGAEVP